MEDITPGLLKKIQSDFQDRFDKSSLIKELYEKVRDGTATYLEANKFAIEVGDILAATFRENLSSDVLPDGKMYYNIAQRIIDFTSGSCYAINGNLQKISNYIFIITPQSVEISGDFQDIFGGSSFDMPLNN